MHTIQSLFDSFSDPKNGERIIGTYLSPLTLFTSEATQSPATDLNKATEVIKTININQHEIMITRTGGLFTKPPENLSDRHKDPTLDQNFKAKMQFVGEFVKSLNLLICELSLSSDLGIVGAISRTVTHADIGRGQLIGNLGLLTNTTLSNCFGRERVDSYIYWLLQSVNTGNWFSWTKRQEGVLEKIEFLECTSTLNKISETIPPLIIGAYTSLSSQQFSEATIDSWMVIEQIIDFLWKEYTDSLADSKRKTRLNDTRTYSASVRLEVLLTTGIIPQDLSDNLHKVRAIRNDLVHRAKTDFTAAIESIKALKQTIEFICKKEVAEPSCMYGLSW